MIIPKATRNNIRQDRNRLIASTLLLFWMLFGNGMAFASYMRLGDNGAYNSSQKARSYSQPGDNQTINPQSVCVLYEASHWSESDENTDEQEDNYHIELFLQNYLSALSVSLSETVDRDCVSTYIQCVGELYVLHHAWKSHLA